MTPEQIQKALRYNEKQGYSDTEVEFIQGVVGAEQDGDWGAKTVVAVGEWQKRRALNIDGTLNIDGMVGPSTWKAMRREGEDEPPWGTKPSACKPVHGVWMDGPRKHFMKKSALEEMREHGILSLALMVEGSRREFDPKFDFDEVAQLCEWAEQLGMHVGITDWPFPDKQWMADAENALTPMFEDLPLHYTESDVEGNWLSRKVRGYKNLDEAGDALVAFKERLTAAAKHKGCRFETTTYTSHTENGRAADVAPHTDVIFGQAYSVRGRTKKNKTTGKYDVPWAVPWSHTYGPGNMQKHTLDRSMQVPDVPNDPMLGCGLAAYDQKWPGHSAQEAMDTAYSAALVFNPVEVRWWSYKWIFGHLATSYGRKFLKSVL